MATVLKLGGSVITEKDTPETVDEAALENAVETIARYWDGASAPLVLVHGAGSFGHHYAAKHGVTDSAGTTDAAALTEIHASMGELNATVVSYLQDAGVPALPVRPLSVAARTGPPGDATLEFPAASATSMVREGFVPVSHGDAIVHEGHGGTILSGDEIVTSLAASLDVDRVGLCSGVPGVLDERGDVVPEIERYEDVADALGGSDATDVTGGMAGKVRRLLALDAPASIFPLDGLETFFETGAAGTVVGPE